MNVPQLRFDGFSGEWEVKKLKEVTEIIGDGMHSTPTYDEDGMYFFANGSNIQNGKVVFFTDNKKVNYDEFIKYRNKLKQNSILVSLNGATWGRFGRYNNENILLGKSLGFINPIDTIESDYLYYILQTNIVRKYFESVTTGSTIKNLSLETLRNTQLMIPIKAEQNKIASFLMLIEKKIEKQQEKIEKLGQFKKAMMQKIFSQELRFKDDDGGKFDEWKEATLADLGATYTGLSGKTKEDFGHGEASFITYVNVFNNLKASIDGLQAVDLSDGKNQNPVCQGDILFTTSSETPHEVGMASYWAYDQKDVYLNSFCFGFRLTSDVVNGEFLAYLLRSPIYRAIITLLAQGSTRYNISKAGLMKMKVLVPAIKEQRKIVRVLSQIDTKLDKEKEKLMVLEEQKKGLMQRMFV